MGTSARRGRPPLALELTALLLQLACRRECDLNLIRHQGIEDYPLDQGINGQGQAVSLPLPLPDFAKAYDGPPTDPKVFEENQKKLQEELQKRADEARKRLEANPPSGGAPATPTPNGAK